MNLKNAIIESVSTRKDRSLKVVLGLPEVDPKTMAEIMFNANQEVLEIEIPDEQRGETKSRGQRLRGVLYKVWEQNHKENFSTFELFYAHKMEQIIEKFKEKLE